MAPYVDALPRGVQARTVLCLHNVGSLQYRRMLRMRLSLGERALYTLKWLAMLRWEAAAARRFDRAVVVSASERDALRRSDPRLAVSIVENGVDATALAPLPEPPVADTLLFVGTFTYRPNVDAALLLVREIFPLVRRAVPAARLLLVGHEPPEAVRALAREPGVSLAGALPDVNPAYERAAVAVAPLRAGGGTRLKILEAMALGRPVVSTRIGAEGLAVVDHDHLLLSDTPGDFAASVARLLGDRPLRVRLAANARRLVEARYDWARPGDALLDVYRGLAARPAAGARDPVAEEAI
jgi:glycosyltransferase involved in cell wall biosynthesis